MQAYCVKRKAKKEMKDPKEITDRLPRVFVQPAVPKCSGSAKANKKAVSIFRATPWGGANSGLRFAPV